MPRFALAVDIGGTFTDTVVIDVAGRAASAKAPTTAADLSIGVIASLANAARRLELTSRELLEGADRLHLASTVATNALLTYAGPISGHLTTLGMEDNLGIGRLRLKSAGVDRRAKLEPSRLEKPRPLVPRRRVRGVVERVDSAGCVLVALDPESVRRATRELVAEGVEALSVCLLWSCRNPVHELRIREIVRSEHPELDISLSSEVCPLVGEYERAATTVIDSFVGRLSAAHLAELEAALRERGFAGAFRLMQAGGGLLPLETARQRPVLMLNSGPSGGVVGAAALARDLGDERVITADVGGTSFDVSIVRDGAPEYASAPRVGRHHVFVPMLDVRSIGSGGGSIARVEADSGRLEVGPESAGAEPGPACYGRGGELPTLTDADGALGRIDPDYFLGGTLRLDRERAMEAIERHIAKPLGLDVVEAASGVVRVADSDMASLIHNMTIGEGHDPRRFVVYAYGGLSGLHVTAFGRSLGVGQALVPRLAGVFSAFGVGSSDCVHVAEESVLLLQPWSEDAIAAIFGRLERQARENLSADSAASGEVVLERSIDLRYRGQVHEVAMPLGSVSEPGPGLGTLTGDYQREYERRYGQGTALSDWPIEAVACRVIGRSAPAALALQRSQDEGEDPAGACKGSRPVYLEEHGSFIDVAVYERDRLRTGNRVVGPAVIESVDTNVLLRPEQVAHVDAHLDLRVAL